MNITAYSSNPEYISLYASTANGGGGSYDTIGVQNGDVRVINGKIHTFSYGSWVIVDSNLSIFLTVDTLKILDWAREKMEEEEQLKHLLEKYPALKKSKEQFEILHLLIKEYHE